MAGKSPIFMEVLTANIIISDQINVGFSTYAHLMTNFGICFFSFIWIFLEAQPQSDWPFILAIQLSPTW
jgi:hypothetical protein